MNAVIEFGETLSKPMNLYFDHNRKEIISDRRIKTKEAEQTGPLF